MFDALLTPIWMAGWPLGGLVFAQFCLLVLAVKLCVRRKLLSDRRAAAITGFLIGVPFSMAPLMVQNPVSVSPFTLLFLPSMLAIGFGPLAVPFALLALFSDRIIPQKLLAIGGANKLKVLGCGAHGATESVHMQQLSLAHSRQLPAVASKRRFAVLSALIAIGLPLWASCGFAYGWIQAYTSSFLGGIPFSIASQEYRLVQRWQDELTAAARKEKAL